MSRHRYFLSVLLFVLLFHLGLGASAQQQLVPENCVNQPFSFNVEDFTRTYVEFTPEAIKARDILKDVRAGLVKADARTGRLTKKALRISEFGDLKRMTAEARCFAGRLNIYPSRQELSDLQTILSGTAAVAALATAASREDDRDRRDQPTDHEKIAGYVFDLAVGLSGPVGAFLIAYQPSNTSERQGDVPQQKPSNPGSSPRSDQPDGPDPSINDAPPGLIERAGRTANVEFTSTEKERLRANVRTAVGIIAKQGRR